MTNSMSARKRAQSALEGRLAPPQLVRYIILHNHPKNVWISVHPTPPDRTDWKSFRIPTTLHQCRSYMCTTVTLTDKAISMRCRWPVSSCVLRGVASKDHTPAIPFCEKRQLTQSHWEVTQRRGTLGSRMRAQSTELDVASSRQHRTHALEKPSLFLVFSPAGIPLPRLLLEGCEGPEAAVPP